MKHPPGPEGSTAPALITKLLGAAKKEIFRQYNTVLDVVQEQLDKLGQDSEDYLQLADELCKKRPTMVSAFSAQWQVFEKELIQPKQAYKQQLKGNSFSLVSDDDLEEKLVVQRLIANSLSAFNFVMIPIASGFSQAMPDADITQAKIPFFPQCVGECLQESLTKAKLSSTLDQILRKQFRDKLLPNFKHLYIGIRKQLENSGFILEEAPARDREEVLSGEQGVSTGSRLIEVPEDFDLNILELLQSTDITSLLGSDSFEKPSLSNVPDGIGEDKSIITISNKDVDNMLEVIQNTTKLKDSADMPDIHQTLAENLQRNSSDTQYSVMSHSGENIINLAALMFDFIQNDQGIPPIVSTLLMQLQIPYMRLALSDADLFIDQAHPAKELLNNLTEISYRVTSTDSEAFHIINDCVNELTHNFTTNKEQVASLTSKTSNFLMQLVDSANVQELSLTEQARIEADQEERVREAEAAVKEFVALPISKMKKPMFFHLLLEKVWSKVLYISFMKYLPLSDERTEVVDVFNKILWSTGVGKSSLQKSELMRELPTIVKGIEKVFTDCQIDELIQSHFMEQLKDIHLSFIKKADGQFVSPAKKATKEPDASESNVQAKEIFTRLAEEQAAQEKRKQQQEQAKLAEKMQQAVGHDYQQFNQTTNAVQAKNETLETIEESLATQSALDSKVEPIVASEESEADEAEKATTETSSDDPLEFSFPPTQSVSDQKPAVDKPSSITDEAPDRLSTAEAISLVNKVRTGTRMNYMIKGEFTRCKVAFHSASLEKYIFTNNHGFKLFERSRADLLVDIQNGYAKVLDNQPTFDRALESVVANIRQHRSS
ncbi:DUF1631 family protein [Endozoicomonas sp. SM1973]|uniref:DUF1631 family protein n=1 Tax=Spartinivicinus marinus TaxID=2994442 RepID=A0A853IH99_9GAMM|nr:DUF1631 family protein [Spartinivicinus marinus]MCX4029604.1 DUF1631 family protein [Spartinivicinus marinus]NYZ68817.1 DUF1631 family protein [Spartinivicinus marinus]